MLVLDRILSTGETHLLFSLFSGGGLNLSLTWIFRLILWVCTSRPLIFGQFLILFIGSWRQLHLVAQLLLGARALRLGKYLKLTLIFKDFIAEKYFVNNFIVGSRLLEERVVHVTSSGWVDSDEVASSLVLEDRFPNIFFIFKVRCFDQRLKEWRVFNRVVVDEPLDEILHLDARLTTVDVLAHHVVW